MSVGSTWRAERLTRATKEVDERAELHRTIWRIAYDLRESIGGWDFKTYVLEYWLQPLVLAKRQVAKRRSREPRQRCPKGWSSARP